MIERIANKQIEQKQSMFAKNPSFLKDNYFSKQIGVNYKLNECMSLKSSAGSFYRIPNMFELFGDRGYTVGNIALKPEQSFNVDASIIGCFQIKKINISAEIIGFHRSVNNLIQWLSYSTQIMYPENIGKAALYGFESNIGLAYSDIYYKCAFSYLQTENKESSVQNLKRRIPAKPEIDISNEIGYNNKKIGMKIYCQYNFTGESYKDLDNQYKNDISRYTNIGATYSKKNISVNFETKNLTDELSQDVYGFPLPGRSFYGRLNFNF